ncbi:glycosyltransferase family 10 domain-containing protein [Azospirillum picis]|uniref:Alpha-1,3-fucosyltransferase n=1 Tax=Azospirillum picis TaxID=488438 RepID=A0ABU0MLQ7_9PROT|nr:glycosyltransferase family 10 [Azospirillum picis]MBP2300478.1 hypothetical protein [Azospirillum picis]MDQ0534274.1 hypothetical protein [Azospirillum picis]
MIDARTSAFLADFFAGGRRNPLELERFLLTGPDGPRRGAKPPLKLAFHDFWPEFDSRRNFFTALLATRFAVRVVEDDSDLAIVSVFGGRHREMRSARSLYFTGENRRPPLDSFDMAVSFDRLDDPRHFRLPLYVVHAHDHFRETATPLFCQPVLPPVLPSRREFQDRGFCAFLYKNPHAERRNAFFAMLDARRRVDAVGWHLNNTGSVVRTGWLPKIKVFQRYRFAFAFENSSHPGYLTEKILDAFQAGTVPLYWGDPELRREVAAGSFIDVSAFPDDEAACSHILALDEDYDAWCAVRGVPPFLGTEDFHFDVYRLVEFIEARL